MVYLVNHPIVLAVVCGCSMWLMARLGIWLRVRFKAPEEEIGSNLAIIVSATLTLLGLIIGFTFSMATSRYDQRKLYEEQEANAIGTEYVRADLLAGGASLGVKQVLIKYLDGRIDFYQTNYGLKLTDIDEKTASLQSQLWKAVQPQAAALPNPITALVVSGMNDVLNSQGYTQYAWRNRIPPSAWGLMITIALFSNVLIGYGSHRSRHGYVLLLVLPAIVSISFFLIADIDSPRGGVIRVAPQNLLSLAQSLHSSN